MGTVDPDGLMAGTREVMYWAVTKWPGSESREDRGVALEHGSEPTAFRSALLDAWALAGQSGHAKLRLVFPEYAGAILMFQHRALPGVVEFYRALNADLIDIASARRATYRAPRG